MAADVPAGERSRVERDVLGSTLRDNEAAVRAGAGSQIYYVIRAANRLFIVFDDKNRVSQITKVFKRIKQLAIVARVETNRGLVQNIQHTSELRADLRRKPDALAFTARERRRRSIERDISEADSFQKAHALANFSQDQPRYTLLSGVQSDRVKHLDRLRDWDCREVADGSPANSHRQRRRLEPSPLASGTHGRRNERLESGDAALALHIFGATHQIRHRAFPLGLVLVSSVAQRQSLLGPVEK